MAKGFEGLANEISKDHLETAKKARAVIDKYDYLRKLMLEGWVWEFISRNGEYKRAYSEIKKSFEDNASLKAISDFEEFANGVKDSDVYEKFKDLTETFKVRPFLLEHKRKDAPHFIEVEGIPFQIGVPNPTARFADFEKVQPFPFIVGAGSVNSFRFGGEPSNVFADKDVFRQYCYEIMIEELPPTNYKDTLYFGVSVHGKKEDIIRQVKAILKDIKASKKRAIDKKWKYYLITYDLVAISGMKYKEVADVLAVAFEKDKNLFDERNIENYYKNAVLLINGGYKEHLFLTK